MGSTKEDELLSIDRRLLGFSALSNFGNECSSSRYVMFSNFLGQYIPLDNGEPKILLSGVEEEFIKTLFGRKIENDSKILSIVDRYDGKTSDRVSTTTERFVIYLDLVKGELNYINIPIYEKFNPKFGFSHRETDVLDDIERGDILEAGTKITKTNSENDDGELCIGLNVNMCLASFKEGGEDAIVISESLASRGSFKTYETAKLQFGLKDIPINLYGDDEHYKIIPDIGEHVHETGILFATRHVYEHTDNTMLPALMSRRHLKYPRPIFDKCFYMKNNSGKVIDIKVLHTPKNKKISTYTLINEQMDKYVQSLKDFNNTFINTIEDIQKTYGKDLIIGDKLHKMLVDLYSTMDPKLTNIMNQEPLDLYLIEITVEFEHKLGIGTKMSGIYGDKGVVCKIIPDDEMPIDGNGFRADAIMDQKSVASRMNSGKLYDGYLTTTTKVVKMHIEKVLTEHLGISNIHKLFKAYNKNKMLAKMIHELWEYIVQYLKILGNEQYDTYREEKNILVMIEVLEEIVKREFYVMLPIDNSKRARDIVLDIEKSVYAPIKTTIKFKSDGIYEETKDKIAIETVYMLILSKIADTWLAASTAKTNHFGVPITTSRVNKRRQPWSPNPVKTGETETRLYASYAGREAIAELRDRSASIATHKHMYANILSANKPTNIEKVVDRTVVGYDDDKPVKLFESILNVGGVETIFIPESTSSKHKEEK